MNACSVLFKDSIKYGRNHKKSIADFLLLSLEPSWCLDEVVVQLQYHILFGYQLVIYESLVNKYILDNLP